jgi:GTPase SAR1 family protein
MAANNDNYLSKMPIIGTFGVGKSCRLLYLAEDMGSDNGISTIATDFNSRKLDVDGKSIKLQICDNSG